MKLIYLPCSFGKLTTYFNFFLIDTYSFSTVHDLIYLQSTRRSSCVWMPSVKSVRTLSSPITDIFYAVMKSALRFWQSECWTYFIRNRSERWTCFLKNLKTSKITGGRWARASSALLDCYASERDIRQIRGNKRYWRIDINPELSK